VLLNPVHASFPHTETKIVGPPARALEAMKHAASAAITTAAVAARNECGDGMGASFRWHGNPRQGG
jgi:hypothetical protein